MKPFYLLSFSVFLFFSCNKDNDNAPSLVDSNFTAKEILASSATAKLGDVEFDARNNRISWQTIDDHSLWVCKIDPVTGVLAVPDGKQTLIDASIAPLTTTYNSGEWAFSQAGTAIVYGKIISNKFYIAIAAESGNTWTLNTLTGNPNRFNPRATKNHNDAVAAMLYLPYPGTGTTYYKGLNNVNNEFTIANFKDAHWAEDEQLLTGILPNNQVGLFNPSSPAAPIQLTFNSGTTYSRPYMWRAPEYGNARMFFTKANGTQIQVFKETTQGSNQYTLFQTFTSPSANASFSYIASPEPFIYKGKSYISFMASPSALETSGLPAEIWFAGISATAPLFRKVSDDASKVRTDPETYATSTNLYIYYTEVNDSASPDNTLDPTTILTLRRCETGL